jgi:pyruvate dehydrogenase E2 component (dihydrolipoamide acetyltransferase)
MRRELLMPKLGLTMAEGVMTEWLLAPGTAFKAGDSIFIIESEKAAVEVPADADADADADGLESTE